MLLDPEIPPDRVIVYLTPVARQPHVPHHGLDCQHPLDANGEFLVEKCRPGKHVLRLLLDVEHTFDDEQLLVVEDVFTEPGARSTDPRCQPADLRGKIHAFRLTVITPDGSPAAPGRLLVDERWRTLRPLRGWTDLETPTHLVLTTKDEVDIDVRVPGCRGVHLEDVSEDRTVQLQRGLALRLFLPEDVELPEPQVTWSIQLHGERVDVLDEPAAFAPGSRELRVVAAEPGVVEIEWLRVESVDGDRVRASTWGAREGEPRQRLEIRDVPGEQVFELLPLAPP